ncbi:MAG: hypothetical protein AB1505_36930 [Candidatus Latescibacterota bacterium]
MTVGVHPRARAALRRLPGHGPRRPGAGRAYRVTGFVDDDPGKQRASIHGVTVLGTRRDVPRLIDQHQVQELLITPAALACAELTWVEAGDPGSLRK